MSIARFLLSGSAVFLMLSLAVPVQAVSVLNETFANDSAFTKADADSAATFFRDTEDDNEYWGINDPTGSTDDYDGDPAPAAGDVPPYSLFSGNFLNAEDLNAQRLAEPARLDWSNLNISGLTDIMFSGLFAARGDFEDGASSNGDFIRVQYRIDSDTAAFTNLLWFSPEASPSEPDRLCVDDNFDGIGTGTPLTVAAQSFSAPIAGTGSTLDLRILMGVDGDEEVAFDSISVMAAAVVTGDYNQDGTIDAADYVVWRKGVGIAPTLDNYNLWRANFGQSAGGGSLSNGTVPEPPAAMLLIWGAAIGALMRHRMFVWF